MPKIVITGGAGFIGSNFTRSWLARHPDWDVVVFDKLTYAGNLDNLRDLEGNPRYRFIKGDICDAEAVEEVVREAEHIVSMAAETHVDRSLLKPGSFILTDVFGTHVLLEAVSQNRERVQRFLQVSSDEVYGTVLHGSADEQALLCPSSPYSASKAGGDLMVLAYYTTYKLPVLITRGTNNFGPYQYPEKFIPLLITNAIDDLPLPIYGDGLQVRDWIYVLDHCYGVETVLEKGIAGEIYNIGAGNERPNIEIARLILKFLNKPQSLIRHVADRPGHDRRYSVDTTKLRNLGWQPQFPFEEALEATVKWYVDNQWWWRKIKESPVFQEYYRKMYEQRPGWSR